MQVIVVKTSPNTQSDTSLIQNRHKKKPPIQKNGRLTQ